MSDPRIIVLEDQQALYVRAAEEIAHFVGESISVSGEFTVALAGGSTPAEVYELLATRFRLSVDWKEMQFFWGDERCVPPDDEASNYGMAARSMLDRIDLRPDQIHRIRGEDSPEAAARAYEEEIRSVFSLGEDEFPRFDLVMLGMGENAHTASLFPNSPAIHEQRRLAVVTEGIPPHATRISITPGVINHAARVLFVVSGAGKAEAVKAVLEGPHDPDRYPAQIVQPEDAEYLWMLDQAAARLLSHR